MPEVIFAGPEGRLEGRYHHSQEDNAPIALILHPHPKQGGTMNNRVVFELYNIFAKRGYSTLRFNFRGVGRSQGKYDEGTGELSDAASALDWLQASNPNAKQCWVGGFSFGAWICMQLLMRRPEIDSFISVGLPANKYDFSFLAPCPSSGLILHGLNDTMVPEESVSTVAKKLSAQKKIEITYNLIKGANHFFHDKTEELNQHVSEYLDKQSKEISKMKAKET
ncbi:MAG: alpha/beta hydrolase [Rhodospirillaceae bacterium]|nr:alpha/beta hydrolase [Rhodospirillaceae bacterium]